MDRTFIEFICLLVVVVVLGLARSEGLDDIYPFRNLLRRRGLDYCHTNENPCQNGGQCCSAPSCQQGGVQYTCHCKGSYVGRDCEKSCPIKKCWSVYYDKAYSRGRKRSLAPDACKSNVETLSSCLQVALASPDACNCDDTDRSDAKTFAHLRKDKMLEGECSRYSSKCEDNSVSSCLSRVHKVGGVMDRVEQPPEDERCALVREAVTCMEDIEKGGKSFAGCSWAKGQLVRMAAIRQAQWQTWCMGKYCSLSQCGDVKVPQTCSEDAVKAQTKPVVSCMRDRLKTCLPNELDKLQTDLDDIQRELDRVVTDKCKLAQQVRGMCKATRGVKSAVARELLRALLDLQGE